MTRVRRVGIVRLNVKRRGLTMGEMVIAVGLLGIIVVFIAALFVRLLTSSTKGSHQTVGVMFAQRRLDAAQRTGPPYWGAENPLTKTGVGDYRESTSGNEGVYFQDDQSQTEFYYRFEAALIRSKPMGDLYRLKCDVAWWPSTQAVADKAKTTDVRREMGKQSVSLSRVFYWPQLKQ